MYDSNNEEERGKLKTRLMAFGEVAKNANDHVHLILYDVMEVEVQVLVNMHFSWFSRLGIQRQHT
jgi:hypothetical protein